MNLSPPETYGNSLLYAGWNQDQGIFRFSEFEDLYKKKREKVIQNLFVIISYSPGWDKT